MIFLPLLLNRRKRDDHISVHDIVKVPVLEGDPAYQDMSPPSIYGTNNVYYYSMICGELE